ncbi:MAG: hypothetical protein ACOCWM_00595 [Cyclobacteriaceae bacterium]
MKTTKLITGQFTPIEAKEILLSLVDSKINFHKIKSLSSMVRCNQLDADSELKILALEKAKEQLLATLQQAINENCNLNIESTINISFVAKEQIEEVNSKVEHY